jgi:hypothetical protein
MKTSKYPVIALLSVTLIALELVWTRIFSAEFFYTFAFLILSLAIMGLGLGALALRLFPVFDRPHSPGIFLSLSGLMTIFGPPLVFQLGLDFSQLFASWLMIGKFIVTVFLLSASFFFGGMALALLFKHNHQDMPRLYMADLLGAGLGVLLIMLAMNQFGTPVATFLTALPVLLAAFLAGKKWLKVLPLLFALFLIFPLSKAETLLEAEHEERAPVIYKHWDALAKIKIFDYGEDYHGINIDNVANSTVNHFDGNWDIPDSLKNNLVNQIVQNGWKSAADSADIDISPSTDNRPFIAQLGMWKNLNREKLNKVIPYADLIGFPLSKIIIVMILLVMIILIIPLNLIPYFKKEEKLKAVPWLYFFTIGMAFMMVEIILMQKYSLFIGPPVYSIITILLVLLTASGIGSRFSQNIPEKIIFPAIALWIVLDIIVFRHLIYILGDLTMLPRILVTALLVFPVGFFMGMPFPKGALRVGSLIDWGFAVNGAASVLGSTIIVLVAFSFGFSAALLLGAVLYVFAYILLSLKTAW